MLRENVLGQNNVTRVCAISQSNKALMMLAVIGDGHQFALVRKLLPQRKRR